MPIILSTEKLLKKHHLTEMENKEYLMSQENLYWGSEFLDKKWYRKIYGGKWRFLKIGKDTPYIGMFCVWTKMDDKSWSGYKEVLDVEEYDYTGVDTRLKFYKKFFKNLIK